MTLTRPRSARRRSGGLRWLPLLIAVPALSAETPPKTYAAGQVWEYRTRPVDRGSVLKIQAIEPSEKGNIYHISLIGLHFANTGVMGILGHAPVNRETLDASVTRLSERDDAFPDPQEGIAEWRSGHGGVFTIDVARIAELVDQQVSGPAGREALPVGADRSRPPPPPADDRKQSLDGKLQPFRVGGTG